MEVLFHSLEVWKNKYELYVWNNSYGNSTSATLYHCKGLMIFESV